jgi:hypothetical protein
MQTSEADIDEVELDLDDSESGAIESKRVKKARFVIENDNDGTVIRLRAKLTAKISKVVARMYIELGRGRQDGDRLTRISDGSNVFESMDTLVSDYIGDERKRVRWAFVGEQGGARS